MFPFRAAIVVVLLWTEFLPILGAVPQTLNWTAPDHPVLPLGTLHPLRAEASSGLPVQFRVLSGPASIVGDQLLVTNVAEVSVIAEQLGDETYRPVASVRAFNDFRVELTAESDLKYGSDFRDMVTSGDRVFALGGQGTVSFLRVPALGPLEKLGQYRSRSRVSAMAASETKLFLYYPFLGRLEAIDLVDPAHPQVAGWVQMASVNHMEFRDNVLYLALGDAGAAILDVSDPARMRYLAQIGKAFDQSVDQVATSGDRLYLSVPAGLQILDISNLAHPRLIGGFTTSSGRIVPLPDQHVGMADWVSLRLLDARDPQRVREVGHHNFREGKGRIANLKRWGELLLLSDSSGFLEVLNVGNPVAPRLVGRSGASPSAPVATTVPLEILGDGSRILTVENPGPINLRRMVRRIPQEIQWIQPVQEVLELDRPHRLEARTSSGLPIEWSVVSGSASIGDEGLRLTGKGPVAVLARQAGTAEVPPVELRRTFNATRFRAEKLGTLSLGGDVFDLCVSNRLAYVALGRGGVKVIDLHRPEAPSLMASFSATKEARRLVLSEQRLVVVGGDEIAVVDVREPTQPQVLEHVAKPGLEGVDAGAWDSQMLVLGSRGLYRFDLADIGAPWNPLDPYIPTADFSRSVRVRSSLASVSRWPGFDLWDVSDPQRAIQLAPLWSSENVVIYDVWMGSALVWVVSSSLTADWNDTVGRLDAYRVDDPRHPQKLGLGVAYRDRPASVTATESLAFVGRESGGHHVFDVRDPGQPRLFGALEGTLRLVPADGILVATTRSADLQVYTWQEKVEQRLDWGFEDRSVLTPGVGHDLDIRSSSGLPVQYEVLSGPAEVRGGVLTVTNESILQSVVVRATQSGGEGYFPVESVHVFNPLAVDFELLGELKVPGWASAVSVLDGHALVAGWEGASSWVDVRDPSKPRLANFLGTGFDTSDVTIAGGFGYAADFSGILVIVDLRNPGAPLPVAAVGLDGQARRVVVDGNHAYVSIQGGIDVVDVSDPHRPFVQGIIPNSGALPARGLLIRDGFLYVSEWSGGFSIVDIRDPSRPVVANSLLGVSGSGGSVADGNRLWLEGLFGGLYGADISDPSHPRWEVASQIPLPDNFQGNKSMALRDGIIFCSGARGLEAVDIHDSNYVLASGSHPLLPAYLNGIEVVGDLAYVAAGDRGLMIFRIHRGIRAAVGDLGMPTRGESGESIPLPGLNHDGVPMQYEVVSGPAHIEGRALALDAPGTVVLKAALAAGNRYLPADALISISIAPLVLDAVAGSQREPASLNWRLANDVLESAASPAGPWIAIPEARPPFRPTIGNEPRFYRVMRK